MLAPQRITAAHAHRVPIAKCVSRHKFLRRSQPPVRCCEAPSPVPEAAAAAANSAGALTSSSSNGAHNLAPRHDNTCSSSSSGSSSEAGDTVRAGLVQAAGVAEALLPVDGSATAVSPSSSGEANGASEPPLAALLPHGAPAVGGGGDSSDEHSLAAYLQEFQRLASLAVPLGLQNVASYALSIISAIAIGRLGAVQLSASVLANSVYNCTGLSIAMGLSAGMETLCGQAYGAAQYPRVGLILQRALLVCWTACLPIAALWLSMEPLLLLLGQQPDIAAMAGTYLSICIPCLFLSVGIECLRKYLQAQRVAAPAMAIAAVVTALAPALFWLLVFKAGMGLPGAAFAYIGCQATMLAGLLGYTIWHTHSLKGTALQTWPGFSAEAFQGWREYLGYGVPAAAMICMEWWAYEVVIILSGLLPEASVALATMGVCLNINAFTYMLPLGLASAVNISVSNALGAGDAAGARRVFMSGLLAAVCLQVGLISGMLWHAEALVRLLCNDDAVVALCLQVLPIIAGLMCFDGVSAVLSGVLRGSGRQVLGATINLAGYWIVGVPLAAVLAFKGGMGVHGLWLGIAVGDCLQALVLLTLLLRWDWKREVARVQALLEANGGKMALSMGH